jgi:hypothetical protein
MAVTAHSCVSVAISSFISVFYVIQSIVYGRTWSWTPQSNHVNEQRVSDRPSCALTSPSTFHKGQPPIVHQALRFGFRRRILRHYGWEIKRSGVMQVPGEFLGTRNTGSTNDRRLCCTQQHTPLNRNSSPDDKKNTTTRSLTKAWHRGLAQVHVERNRLWASTKVP